ncbi:MAG: hypothetical protein ACRD1L_10310, partial [Terriglobales bacterium]
CWGLCVPPAAVGGSLPSCCSLTGARAGGGAATGKPKAKPAAGIAPGRARQIQRALVGAGYLRRVSGLWDAASATAMKKFQSDRHWQTHYVPDARALIALGLGPSPAIALAATRRR